MTERSVLEVWLRYYGLVRFGFCLEYVLKWLRVFKCGLSALSVGWFEAFRQWLCCVQPRLMLMLFALIEAAAVSQ